jgi:hypothetical protein
MKISVLQSHPAYHDWAFKVCRFFLDGVPRNNVLFADEEARFALTRRLDEFGNAMRHPRTGELLTDEFRGAVRVECPDWLRYEIEDAEALRRQAVTS